MCNLGRAWVTVGGWGGGEGLNDPWEAQAGAHQTNYGGKMLDIWLSLKKACGWRSGPSCPHLFETWIAQVGIRSNLRRSCCHNEKIHLQKLFLFS
jgi:hypothetical protein